MDLARRRALTRERVRRHRAIRAGVEKLMGKQFLPIIPKVTVQPESNSDSTDTKNIESSDEDSTSNDSARKDSIALPNESLPLSKNDIGENSQEQATGVFFDIDTVVSKLKSSPPESPKTPNSYTENQYPENPPRGLRVSSTLLPASEEFQDRLQNSAELLPQEQSWTSMPSDGNVLQRIFEGMQKLANEQNKLTMAVNRMSSALERLTGDVPSRKHETFEKQYKLELPFATKEDFVKFDDQLVADESCRTGLIHSLYQKYDVKKTVTKNLTAILRKYLTREVALTYTAQKCVAGKSVFKDTIFSSCLLETIDSLADDKSIAPVPDNEYYGHLGSVLSNAKDWGVARTERAAKRRRILP